MRRTWGGLYRSIGLTTLFCQTSIYSVRQSCARAASYWSWLTTGVSVPVCNDACRNFWRRFIVLSFHRSDTAHVQFGNACAALHACGNKNLKLLGENKRLQQINICFDFFCVFPLHEHMMQDIPGNKVAWIPQSHQNTSLMDVVVCTCNKPSTRDNIQQQLTNNS